MEGICAQTFKPLKGEVRGRVQASWNDASAQCSLLVRVLFHVLEFALPFVSLQVHLCIMGTGADLPEQRPKRSERGENESGTSASHLSRHAWLDDVNTCALAFLERE